MKIKYCISALLCLITLLTSIPVYAAEVTGGDANNGIMLLSEDYGIATAGTYYPNTVADGYISKSVDLSLFTDVVQFDLRLFDIYLSDDSDFYNYASVLNMYIPIYVNYDVTGLTFEESELFDYKFYFLVNGKKYYFSNTWSSVIPDQFFIGAVITCYVELTIKNNNDSINSTLDILLNNTESGGYGTSSGTVEQFDYRSGYSIPITVSWSGVEWDLVQDSHTNSGLMYNILHFIRAIEDQLTTFRNEVSNHVNNIITNITNFSNNVTNQFEALFTKMDEKQEEIINGYDDTQGTETNNELSDSLGTYQETEQTVTDEAFSGIGEYTVTEEGAQSFAVQFLTVFPLVASMLQSMYQSASSFNIIISVLFTTIIASMVIGLFRFYRR